MNPDLMTAGVSIDLTVLMASPITNITSTTHSIDVLPRDDAESGWISNVVVNDKDPLVRDVVIHIQTEQKFVPEMKLISLR